MRIAVRADSSRQIGTGHITRCRTLAQALRQRGADVTFICRAHEGHVTALLERDGFPIVMLPAPGPQDPTEGDVYARWRGVSEDQDALETVQALGRRHDWVIVDHYGLTRAWETQVRSSTDNILAIDDLARRHDADIVLDQNFSRDPQARYLGRIRENSRILLGPEFALLQPEYASRASSAQQREIVERILVFFGGSDPANMTGRAVEALTGGDFNRIRLDVVVGAANPHKGALEQLARAQQHMTLHEALPSLSALMSQADLAVGAGGGTTWERCCLGLPALVISIAENQVPASRDLDADGVIQYLGSQDVLTGEDIRSAVRALLDAPARRQAMSEQGRRLVDGLGARRVAEAMLPTKRGDLTMRRAAPADSAFYFRLVNDPDVRRQSFRRDQVTWDGHKRWYESKMQDSSARLYVMEANGLPIGQVRFDTAQGKAALDYSLDLIVRGRGWGTRLVELGLMQLAGEDPREVLAEVRTENVASRMVFDRLGFNSDSHADRTRHTLAPAELLSRFGRSNL
jgi:UDP-2,4-diacetamido-2,4,6-trideoxy-beta-L-altropyranose hydrolase